VGEIAAAVRQHHLQLGIALHHAVEDEMASRHRGLQRVADDVVEVVIEQPLALGVAGGMHEDDHVELLHLGKEFFQAEPAIGELRAIHVAVDLDPAQAQGFHAVVQLR
jgi:hypothetical protein